MISLFDTHAHLDFPAFDKDRDQVIARAREAGVEYIVTIGSGDGLECMQRALEVAESRENIWATAGVHPHDAKKITDEDLSLIRDMAKREKVVAIGEIGLDYFKNYSPREVQIKRFRDQLGLARELDVPVVIHDRDAHGDLMRILREDGAPRAGGIMHCYAGSPEMARQLLAMGFYISFPGTITYKNARQAPEVAASLPADRILIETDCPFLTPMPHRGKRNEPAYVRLVAETIAGIRNQSLEQVAEATTANAFRAFGISRAGS